MSFEKHIQVWIQTPNLHGCICFEKIHYLSISLESTCFYQSVCLEYSYNYRNKHRINTQLQRKKHTVSAVNKYHAVV